MNKVCTRKKYKCNYLENCGILRKFRIFLDKKWGITVDRTVKKWYNTLSFVPFIPFLGTLERKHSEKENNHVQQVRKEDKLADPLPQQH